MKNTNDFDVRALRKKTGRNQMQFWGPLGVTQSGGSRYESGRQIPAPVKEPVVIAYGSVCSGIEAASCAWHSLGWKPAFFSEIEPFPCAVLAHRFPDVPNLGDMTKFEEWPDATLDVLVGGTPCQSFSVAGLRKGLADPRGNLMLTFGAIARRYSPRWLVWENVPGVLSSNGGRDFGTFLGMLGELGYGFAYRVLDAQFFGVAQRRRRVFVVGCLGDWRSAAAVLFERHSLSGHPAPSREARKVAPTIPSRSTGGGGLGTDFDCDGGVIAMARGQGGAEISSERSPTLTCNHEAPIAAIAFSCKDHGGDAGAISPTLRSMGHYGSHANAGGQVAVCFAENSRAELRLEGGDGQRTGEISTGGGKPGQGMPVVAVAFAHQAGGTQTTLGYDPDKETAPTLAKCQTPAVAVAFQERGRDGGRSLEVGGEVAYALTAPSGGGRTQERSVLTPTMQVRRLTPRECERLQGFPDDWTLIPYRKRHASDCPDGPRYKALGNSMAVPCMKWLGERIQIVDLLIGADVLENANGKADHQP